MKLEWRPFGERCYLAEGDQGCWRVDSDGRVWWRLSVDQMAGQGMMMRGMFRTAERAMEYAQEREDGIEIKALNDQSEA